MYANKSPPLLQRTIRRQKTGHVCCYIKVHILRSEEGRDTRNSFNHLPELFKGQNYFWIITNPVLKKTAEQYKERDPCGGGGAACGFWVMLSRGVTSQWLRSCVKKSEGPGGLSLTSRMFVCTRLQNAL